MGLQVLLNLVGDVCGVFGQGNGDVHIVSLGEGCAPGNETLSCSHIVADGLIQIVDEHVGDVEVAGVQTAQEALEQIGVGDCILLGRIILKNQS